MRLPIAIIVAAAGLGLAHSQEQVHEHHHQAVEASAPIQITINPEVRVSVKRDGDLPPVACGKAMELPVKIVNQGFLTAPLQAAFVYSVPDGVNLEFTEEPLKGIPEEHRILRLTLTKAEIVDVTISFRAKNDISDLGGRDRIHLLLRCY